MITKDGRDVALQDLTPEQYIVPQGEERLYHAVIEVTNFDRKTGKRLSVPRLQKFGRKMFDTLIHKGLLQQGYDVKILHDPTKWVAEHKAAAAASRKAQAEAAKAAEQKKFDDAEAAAKAAAEAEAKAAAKAAKKAEKEAAAAGADKAPSEGK